MYTQSKSILKSWTFWFGIAQIASGVFGLFSANMDSAQAWTLVMTGLASIGFRLKTNNAVTIA